jgi:predicted NAD-dependent protein-ADP-ribosyltransferase YbiA (DUF1768 family)
MPSVTSSWHDILRKKFHSPVERRQLSTGSALLVDGNLHHDNQWGICECLSVAPAARKYGTSAACIGTGRNRHGQLLMQVRGELSTEMMLRAS